MLSNENALELSTGYMLSRFGRLVHGKLEHTLNEMGLGTRHFALLVNLDISGPLLQGAAAQKLAIDKSTIVSIVDDLEAGRLVERKRDKKDRRGYNLTLTEDGRRKLSEVMSAIDEAEQAWFKPLSRGEIKRLHDLLARLTDGPNGWLDLGSGNGRGKPTAVDKLSAGYLISMIGPLMHEEFERALGAVNLRARHFGLLFCLKLFAPIAQGAAAEMMSIDKSTIVSIVDDLEAAGWVVRKKNAADRRAYELVLTDDGTKKWSEALSVIKGLEGTWLKPLSVEERRALNELLSRLLHGPGSLLSNLARS
jgi:DNA-binding MarR family transcriptional regulator